MRKEEKRPTLVAISAVLTRITLSSNSHNIPNLDRLVDLVSNPQDLSDDLVSDDLGVHGRHVTPSGRGGVEVGSADTAVLDFDYRSARGGRGRDEWSWG